MTDSFAAAHMSQFGTKRTYLARHRMSPMSALTLVRHERRGIAAPQNAPFRRRLILAVIALFSTVGVR
jgi:hypothetical protein